MNLADLQIEPTTEPEPPRPRRYVKHEACLVVVDADGRFVSATGSNRVDVQVLRRGSKRPTQLRGHNHYAALLDKTLQRDVDFVLKKKRKGKPARNWVQVDGGALRKLGITEKIDISNLRPHYRFTYPDNVLPSHRTYTEDQLVLMNELLVQGAVWCECMGRHFLAVLPQERS